MHGVRPPYQWGAQRNVLRFFVEESVLLAESVSQLQQGSLCTHDVVLGASVTAPSEQRVLDHSVNVEESGLCHHTAFSTCARRGRVVPTCSLVAGSLPFPERRGLGAGDCGPFHISSSALVRSISRARLSFARLAAPVSIVQSWNCRYASDLQCPAGDEHAPFRCATVAGAGGANPRVSYSLTVALQLAQVMDTG
jgi:hypothetical protein